jgi:DNA polymerase-4
MRSGKASEPTTLCRDCCELSAGLMERCPGCGSDRLVAHDELTTLAIAHVDCDAFYAAVEKRDRPELRDRPVIVGHTGGRGVVTTACYVARTYGVRSAMAMFKALERCPEAVVIRPDMARYKRVSQEIRAICRAYTDRLEPVSLDEAYLDLSGLADGGGPTPAEALAIMSDRIEQRVRITVSIGLSCNKLLAKLASEMRKPRGFSVIGRAEARRVLAPMPVGKINGVGSVTAARLVERGIHTIADLQAMPEGQIVALLGRLGHRLARFAIGEDDRKVEPDRPTKSVSAETTFDRDTARLADLEQEARDLTTRVAGQLTGKELAGSLVTVKLKTADFRLITRSRRLAQPTQQAETILAAALPLIAREADGRHFRLIGIGVDRLVPASEADPPDLFAGS